MKIGKIELTKERMLIAVSLAIAAIALGVYFVLYAPLMSELKTKYLMYKSVEKAVNQCRYTIESAGEVYGQRVLISEKDVSHAIDELTKHAKLNGINFISMSPKKIKKEKNSQYKILPVEMKIKSTYEDLGAFLGSVDDLEKGLIKVKYFNIIPDEEDPSRFMTDLIIDIYLRKGK